MNATRATKWVVLLGATAWLACEKTTSISAGDAGGSGGATYRATGGANSNTGGAAGSTSVLATGGNTTAASGGVTASGGTTGASSGGTGGKATGGASGGAGGTSGGAGGTSAGTIWPVLGGPCSVPGEQSACATAGGDPCRACQGRWLYCANGTWRETHCEPIVEPPRPVEPALDAAPAVDVGTDVPLPIDTAQAETSIDGPSVLRGYMVYANELMAFEPCGTTDLSWANLQGWEKGIEILPYPGPFCVRVDAGMAPCPGTIYVELVGTIYSCAQCGNMGRFRQELRVGAFLAASLTGPPECPFLPPVFPS